MNAVSPLRPPPAPAPGSPPPDARGILAILGVNTTGLAEALAEIEAIRFARTTTPEVREALAAPIKALRAQLAAADAWINRGLGRS